MNNIDVGYTVKLYAHDLIIGTCHEPGMRREEQPRAVQGVLEFGDLHSRTVVSTSMSSLAGFGSRDCCLTEVRGGDLNYWIGQFLESRMGKRVARRIF